MIALRLILLPLIDIDIDAHLTQRIRITREDLPPRVTAYRILKHLSLFSFPGELVITLRLLSLLCESSLLFLNSLLFSVGCLLLGCHFIKIRLVRIEARLFLYYGWLPLLIHLRFLQVSGLFLLQYFLDTALHYWIV